MKKQLSRVPPHNLDAERAVLGSMLSDKNAIVVASENLKPDDFYATQNTLIYKNIIELSQEGKPADRITLVNKLNNNNIISNIGGVSYITSLIDDLVSPANVKHYIDIVKEKALVRQTILILDEYSEKCYGNLDNLSLIISEINQKINNLSQLMGAKTGKRSIQMEVEKWVHSYESNSPCNSTVTISLLSCYFDLGLKTTEEKTACRVAFKRLAEKGIIEPQGGKSGTYKLLDGKADPIDYVNAEGEPYDWWCPLKTQELVNVYPGSIVLIAGESNAGKTSYCLNVAKHYKHDRAVYYFSSEMEDIELKARLSKFNLPLEEWKNVRFVQRHSNFPEVIKPDQLNIIDYLEVHKDFYEVSGLIRNIKDKIGKGIALVAIQKPVGRDEGVGGQNTKNLARLYIAMSPGKAKIVKGKMWASLVNPDGMSVEFKLIGGAKFQLKDSWKKIPF